jgi:hypothetical protein
MWNKRCRQLRHLLTSYVDDEVNADERRLIENHLERCDACRVRVVRERTVRQRLQRWSLEARAEGIPLSWPETVPMRSYPSGGALLRVALLMVAAVGVGLLMWSRGRSDTGVSLAARGQITDSVCAGGHTHASAELRSMSGGDCVRRCVELGAQYVFVSEGVVYLIRNQELQDLVRVAGQEVELQGEVRMNLLTVSRVSPLTVNRSNNIRRSRHGRVS